VQGDFEASEGSLEQPGRRLESLDILRGITIALMIFVDDLGWSWPDLHHAPWVGLHLADVVMPLFLWIVGFSVVTSLRQQREKRRSVSAQMWRAVTRAAKLVAIGLVVSGGGIPKAFGPAEGASGLRDGLRLDDSGGYNLNEIRIVRLPGQPPSHTHEHARTHARTHARSLPILPALCGG
jgi:hypothetical protein